ncbi:MAG: ABC transporter substrate binding protein [Methylococcales bacterium]|nr:ABC transporter substrate binding protein [Methylococcales bacterium]
MKFYALFSFSTWSDQFSSMRLMLCNGLILVLITIMFLSNPVRADDRKLLIVNSNANLLNYQRSEQAFENNQSYQLTHVDLANKSFLDEKTKTLLKETDIVYTIGSKAYHFVTKLGINKPIVFSTIINSLRLPKKDNAYGVANELPAGMQLMMYRYIFPELKKLGIIYSRDMNQEWLDEAISTSHDVGIEIISEAVDKDDVFESKLEALLGKVDALWLIADSATASHETVEKIFDYSHKMKKPVFAYENFYADLGALLVISSDIPTISRQVVTLVDDVLNNRPIDKKIVAAAGFHIILNMKALNAHYSLKLNEQALDSVNQIIE